MRVSSNQPMMTFYAMIDFRSGERRKRPQAATGYSMPEFVKEALIALEGSLGGTRSAKSWAG
jgi:hypothetical protein